MFAIRGISRKKWPDNMYIKTHVPGKYRKTNKSITEQAGCYNQVNSVVNLYKVRREGEEEEKGQVIINRRAQNHKEGRRDRERQSRHRV